MSGNEFVEIKATYLHHTRGAILINDGDRDVWIPKVAVDLDALDEPLISYERGQEIALQVQQWMIEKEGLDGLVTE
jgi:hypothetical protein